MTSRVLGIDLHDAGRDGVYRVAPDDPPTLIQNAARAGLPVTRVDLRDCDNDASVLTRLAAAAGFPTAAMASWESMDAALRTFDAASSVGHVLLFDHANALHTQASDIYLTLRNRLRDIARDWHGRGVPFFVFMEFPGNETRDAAIDA